MNLRPDLIIAVAIIGLASGPSARAAKPAHPNVLFIAVDDLRDWVGHLDGHPNVKTPHIDRLAKRGVSFTRAYCAAPLCKPSRVALLTGLAPSRSGIYGNAGDFRKLIPEAVTLMQHFRAADYGVRGGGKIFHGTAAGDKDSWDEYFTPQRQKLKSAPRDRDLAANAWTPWGPLDAEDDDMFDGKVANWVISQLEQAQERPFFLAYGLTKPHLSWQVPEKYFDLHPLESIQLPPVKEGDLDDVPAYGKMLAEQVYDPSMQKNFAAAGGDHDNVLTHQQWRVAVQAYLATISFADAQIGRVLDALDRSEHADNTIIVLWGDHGWHLGEKEHWRKHALWEVSTRTPLIIAAPEGVAKNRLCQAPVSLIDLYPTLIDLCALPQRDGLDGQSLQPLLKNPDLDWDHPVVTTYGYQNHTVRTDRWRYIHYHDGGQELYDHKNDPNEWTNIAGNSEHRELIRELQAALPTFNQEPLGP